MSKLLISTEHFGFVLSIFTIGRNQGALEIRAP